MSQAVTLKLPDDVYRHVRRAAKGMKEPVEKALVKIVAAATPSLAKVPVAFRAELEAMEVLDDRDLWDMAESQLTPDKQRRLAHLIAKNRRGSLTDQERRALTALRTDADRLMLQRAYAYLLLKYRGHSVPNPTESRG
jgi:hypothetical protein